jgi:hypothetical protein
MSVASLRRVGMKGVTRNGMKGRESREALLATGEGKPLKAEAQGRYSHETRRERFQAEQGVKRRKKPVGAAQPGAASSV